MKPMILRDQTEPRDDLIWSDYPAKDVDPLSRNDVTAQQLPSSSDDELSWTGLFALAGIFIAAMLLVTLLLDLTSRL